MQTVFRAYDETYEMEGFFDSDGQYLAGWSMNDARYRHEYMGPLFKKLGIQVMYLNNPVWIEKLREVFGLGESNEE